MKRWIDERRAAASSGAALPDVEAAPAATVVVLRDTDDGLETLLARRSSKLAFHGGAWVFPGGRIDPEDYLDAPDDLEAAARRGAAREAMEEAQVVVDPDDLVHVSNWTTPEISPKRFATWFFAGRAIGGDGVADGSETEKLQWFAPAEALAAQAAGEIELAPPQYVTLMELQEYATVGDALAGFAAATPVDYLPRFHFADDGVAMCIYSDDVAYDDFEQLDAPGRRHRLYLGDDGWQYFRDGNSEPA